MDWNKTKTILILAFLVLNTFLGYQLWEKNTRNTELAYINEGSLEVILAIQNIHLEAELTGEQPEMSQLNATFLTHEWIEKDHNENQHISVEQNKIISTFVEPIHLSDPVSIEELTQSVLPFITNGTQYKFDHHSKGSTQYLQMVGNYPIFIGTLTIRTTSPSIIEGYEQTYYHIVNSGTEQPVLSSFSSIRTLLDNQIIPPRSTIKDIQLGYYGQVYEVKSQVLTPAWRIMIEIDGQLKVAYVNAITGAIELEFMQQ